MQKPEILAPAGNMEKLKAAIAFGADAVYLAGMSFGMRAAAGNVAEEEIFEAVKYCHEKGVKIYVTVNTMPHTNEYKRLEKHLETLEKAGVDALIISDLGVFMTAKEVVSNMTLHISTQASVVSARTCTEWYKLGASRIVLARELTLAEIKEIKANIPPELELEAFIHGSMCVSYSGRCLLSNYMTGRDANRGACAQPCRWEYTVRTAEIEEVKRLGERFTLIEDEGGTYTFSSRDLCMIEHIPELVESGICSFKIEGRMKSSCYVGAVTNAYRMAIDSYFENPSAYKYDEKWLDELKSVSHRQYDTGFFFGEVGDKAKICDEPGYIKEQAALGICYKYDIATGRAYFTQKNKFVAGEKIELLVPGKTGMEFVCEKIYNENGDQIDSVPHPMMNFAIDVPFEVPEFSILRYAK
jgi:putative protease